MTYQTKIDNRKMQKYEAIAMNSGEFKHCIVFFFCTVVTSVSFLAKIKSQIH